MQGGEKSNINSLSISTLWFRKFTKYYLYKTFIYCFPLFFYHDLDLWKLAIINSELRRAPQDSFNLFTASRQENSLTKPDPRSPSPSSGLSKAVSYTGKINESSRYHCKVSENVAGGHWAEERKRQSGLHWGFSGLLLPNARSSQIHVHKYVQEN